MIINRMIHIIRIALLKNGFKRAEYLKKSMYLHPWEKIAFGNREMSLLKQD